MLIKIPGRIDIDPVTGQITTVFDETPQFPFDDLTLKFRSGPKAPLVNPPSCGDPDDRGAGRLLCPAAEAVDVTNTYQVTEGPGGTACPPDLAHRPFHPTTECWHAQPVSGKLLAVCLPPLARRLEQELHQATVVLPPGLVARIAGISFCPDRRWLRSLLSSVGARELAHPACPRLSDRHDRSWVRCGPRSQLLQGQVYLAGPYKGAPLISGDCCPRHRRSLRSRQRGGPSGLLCRPGTSRSKPFRTPSRRFARGHIESQGHQVEDRIAPTLRSTRPAVIR